MKFEVRVPIAPEPHFFRQVEYLWRSFAAAGGHTGQARFAVWVGADCDPYDLSECHPWSRGNVEWHWVERERFRSESYFATMMARVERDTDADVVLLADADTLLIQDVDDVLVALTMQPMVAGVIAHEPPFLTLKRADLNWERVFESAGLRLPPDRYQHSGWGAMFGEPEHRFGPAYYNLGAVFVPGSMVQPLGKEWQRLVGVAEGMTIDPYYKVQFSLTLAIDALQIPHTALDMRYNFPNDAWADRRCVCNELADVRIIHYLREDAIGKRRETWASDASFLALLERRDLTGSNEILRRTVAELYASSHSSRNPASTSGSIS